jgi:hypothetical protein
MAATNSGKDSVERLIDQWRRERPDVDPRVMGTVGRLLRAAALIGAEIDRFVADRGDDGLVLARITFDILGTVAIEEFDITVEVVCDGRTHDLLEAGVL